MTYTIQMEVHLDIEEEVSQEEMQREIAECLDTGNIMMADLKILEVNR
jgi:hypothetical protein